MTLAVGLVHDDSVYMGTDSAEVEVSSLMVRRDVQMVCIGPFLIGFPGSHRLRNLLRYDEALRDA
jgi:hypothetical protein